MNNPQQIAQTFEASFEKIHQENMRDIPILNSAIGVEAVDFQLWQERMLGIIITPWMMNLVLLPADGEDWSDMQLGDKRPFEFPSGSYKFMANDVDGIGRCMTHSLYSPMREFASHQQAVQIAHDFLRDLMLEPDPDAEAPVDEELLGRVMRGEATPEIDLEQIDELASTPVQVESSLTLDNQVSRRDLLRGKLGA